MEQKINPALMTEFGILLMDIREPWHLRERQTPIHKAVVNLLSRGMEPVDLHKLVLEWPHVATTNPEQIAYTRDERAGEADRQTLTSPCKYVRRHWPHLADHEVRDVVALTQAAEFEILKTTEGIVKGVQEGPSSCMAWDEDKIDEAGGHPYEAYGPEFGWAIAIRRNQEGRIDGRCLLNTAGDQPIFVRSYRRCFVDGRDGGTETYSAADEALEAWLRSEGYKKRTSWPDGTRLRFVEAGNDPGCLLPYIDGVNKRVSVGGGRAMIDDCGEWECSKTDGAAEATDSIECSDCGDRHASDDDGLYVGYSRDRWVCCDCADNYVEAYGRGYNSYWVNRDDVIETVEGDYYDSEYLDRHSIVELANGDYTEERYSFECPVNQERYHRDDGVDTVDEGLVCENETWTCAHSGEVYSNNTDWEEYEGDKYHPDALAEMLKELNDEHQIELPLIKEAA